MIASLIIREVSSLVDDAILTGVFAYSNTGLTCEEFNRYSNPEDYEENEAEHSPDIDFSVEGIPQQSLWYGWYGLDDELDDFITSLSGGLFYKHAPYRSAANRLS